MLIANIYYLNEIFACRTVLSTLCDFARISGSWSPLTLGNCFIRSLLIALTCLSVSQSPSVRSLRSKIIKPRFCNQYSIGWAWKLSRLMGLLEDSPGGSNLAALLWWGSWETAWLVYLGGFFLHARLDSLGVVSLVGWGMGSFAGLLNNITVQLRHDISHLYSTFLPSLNVHWSDNLPLQGSYIGHYYYKLPYFNLFSLGNNIDLTDQSN